MPTIDKRQPKKTVTISLDSYNVLKSITESVTPPVRMEDAVDLLVKMYLEAPDIPNENVEAFDNVMKPIVERFVQTTPIDKREPMEELLEPEPEPEPEEPIAPVLENIPENKQHTEPEQKVYTGLLSRFLRKEGQPIVSKHKVVVKVNGDM